MLSIPIKIMIVPQKQTSAMLLQPGIIGSAWLLRDTATVQTDSLRFDTGKYLQRISR